jgi:hypothetical protein
VAQTRYAGALHQRLLTEVKQTMQAGRSRCGSALQWICGEQWHPLCSARASVRSYFPPEGPAIFRRASDSGRSTSPVTGTASRSWSALRIEGLAEIARGCRLDMMTPTREHGPRLAGIVGILGPLQSIRAAAFARNLWPAPSECASGSRSKPWRWGFSLVLVLV